MREVYKVRYARLNRTVAIKILLEPPGLGDRRRRNPRRIEPVAVGKRNTRRPYLSKFVV